MTALLTACLLSCLIAQAAAKGVTASLGAKWPESPLLLEASEFIAEEGNDKFWQFLGTVQEITIYKNKDSEYSYYSLILKKAGQFLSDLQISLLKLAFSIRAHSPTVQMFQQIATDEPPPEGCSAFASIHGRHTCKPSQIKNLLKEALDRPRPYLYKGDHIFPTLSKTAPVVILYSEIGTKAFATFHKVLVEKAESEEIIYVLRHYIQKPSNRKTNLSGYGVELAIKDTEYKAMDDSQAEAINSTDKLYDGITEDVQGFYFDKLIQMYPDLKDNLVEFRKHLIESTNEMVPLKVWELQDLSFQAASKIVSTPVYEALKVLRDMSQNFPIKARSLTRIALNREMRKEIEENQKHLADTYGIQPGDANLYINGLQFDLDAQNSFSILDILKNEGKALHGLAVLGIKNEDIIKYLQLQVHPGEENYALDIRNSAINWVNDIETDHKYSKWPSSLQELLRPVFPGAIRPVRRNFFSLVLFFDPSQDYAADYVKLAELFYQHNVPLRIGFVFVFGSAENGESIEDAGVSLWRAFNYMVDESDASHAFTSLISMYNKIGSGEVLTVDIVKSVLKYQFPLADVDSVLGINSEYNRKLKAGATFYKKSGLGPLPQVLFNGVPFNSEEMDVEEMETVILQKIMDATGYFQRAVFMGLLNDHMDVVDFLMDQPNIVTRINPTILTSEKTYINFISRSAAYSLQDYETFSYLDSQDKSSVVSENMKYATKDDEDVIYAVTIWIIADFDKPAGRQLLAKAVKHMKKSSIARLGIINNPTSKITEENTLISRAIWAAFLTQKSHNMLTFFSKLSKEETTDALVKGQKIREFLVSEMDDDAFEKKYNTMGLDILRAQELYCREVLKLLPGQMAVISNGRILNNINQDDFHEEDFQLLEKITYTVSAEKIKDLVKKIAAPSKRTSSDLVMKVDSLLSSMPKGESRQDLKFVKQKHSLLKVEPHEDGPFINVIAVVDPLSREAQKMSHLLIVLGRVMNMKLTMFMNCKAKLSEMPLKSFYRLVLEPELIFLSNKSLSPGPVAKFLDMPESPLLTLNMNTPESWLVEVVHSSCDLDNIHLQDVEGIVTANYELEYLLLEGHCFDVTTGQPPRGLQFTLGMKNDPVMVDTIVMANLGYFQLKANPGAWLLRLRKGRSEDIYHIVSHMGPDSPPDEEEVIVVLSNFNSKIIKVHVQKKPDQTHADLLSSEPEEKTGLWNSIMSFTGATNTESKGKKSDVLNIFSVASGHLYERFLRIMMLSVLRYTKTPVKFWFIKNYLSPRFTEIIPHMAQEYGFQYELVQYKWPRWLHQQTEKQRIIWGYKILFLDVLFPLAVDKIIFVDADQIVRTDLKQLRDFDLGGAPYGYTPFCDSRKEMDGYRFWKSGYWASHLGHRKYHISALYVVDLKKFRKIAAGDRLRGQYQALSQDPNSLSNLDQDLPNNMIHQVSIKSLPQEWLWCETWCDDKSKGKAKTIDLCNNPKTKEPKLKAAARIVPEWTDYDNEIRQFLKRIEEQKRNGTQAPPKDLNHDEL
ncbi:UDP-glucose:glycoprotein glucosyltransferase 2 isoform X1 [Hyla sarda]|uniref:UDP-glucose:glycoprotein glucosyltransferase 2 isoform X1 n=1 Tax=Hyla sarda TaxID=327740 RepID=UPI0024C44D1E|nr:UDP-glucose:glycoprotein glucosyltransferase 2 isoform X1 [Hyla sarda]